MVLLKKKSSVFSYQNDTFIHNDRQTEGGSCVTSLGKIKSTHDESSNT